MRGSIYCEVDAKTQSLLMHDVWNLSHKPSQPCFHISPLLLIKPLISAFAPHLLKTSPSKTLRLHSAWLSPVIKLTSTCSCSFLGHLFLHRTCAQLVLTSGEVFRRQFFILFFFRRIITISDVDVELHGSSSGLLYDNWWKVPGVNSLLKSSWKSWNNPNINKESSENLP